MKFLVSFLALLVSTVVLAENPKEKVTSTFENPNNNPNIEEAQMPGTPVPVDELNTSPNPTPVNNESEKFRGTLSDGKYIQDAGLKSKKSKQSQQDLEDVEDENK